MQTIPNKIPRSSHFHLEQINEEVYAAIATGGGGAFSNSGIVNLGERTIIFDTFETPIARFSHYLESLPTLQPRLPNQTFRQEINFHGSERNAVLTFAGPAHTSGDAFLTLPSEKIAFIGDIGFFEQMPYMQDCDPFGWVEILNKLVESDLEIFIPGHGPVGTKEDLKLLEGYIILFRKWVGEFDRKGKPVGDLLQMELPEPYKTWSAVSSRHEANCQFMFDYQGRKK